MFGQGPAHCISTGEEINEILIKDTLGSKDVSKVKPLKITNRAASFFHSINTNSNRDVKREKSNHRGVHFDGRSASVWVDRI